MLKKITGMNYFVALIILLVIIMVLVVTAFGIVTTLPGPLGTAPYQLELKDIYEFEPWTFELNGMTVSFPEGGIIVPAYREDKQEAALLLGEGLYTARGRAVTSADTSGIYLVINQDLFDEKRGDIIFMPIDDKLTRVEVRQIFAKQQGLPVLWPTGIPLVFTPHGSTYYYYFLDSAGAPLLPPITFLTSWSIYGTALVYGLIFMVTILTMLVFSLDHKPTRYWTFIHCARPGRIGIIAVLGAAGLALGGELLPFLTGWVEYSTAAGYVLAAAGLLILARYKYLDYVDFGFRPDMLKHGYLMAGAALGILVFLTRGVPHKIAFNGLASVAEFFALFFLVALTREAIWRGFIQATLGRRFGAVTGWIVTIFLTGLVHYLFLLVSRPWILDYPYTIVETLVLVPGTAAVLGYLYMRTENIVSCAFLHSLILFLPRIYC